MAFENFNAVKLRAFGYPEVTFRSAADLCSVMYGTAPFRALLKLRLFFFIYDPTFSQIIIGRTLSF